MEILFASVRHAWTWTLRLGVVLLIVSALLLSLSRFLLPRLAEYRPDLEQLIGAYLHIPAHIDHLEIAWRGWEPVLRLDGFSLGDPGNPLAAFQQALVSLDLPRSLLGGRPVLRNIRLAGARLILERTADNELRLFALTTGGPPISLQDIANRLFDIHSLDLLSAQLQLHDVTGAMPPLTFPDLRLSLRHKGEKRRLDLAVVLPKALGKELHGALELYGETSDPGTWRSTFYVTGENLALAGWPLPPGYPTGTASLSVWGDWQGQGQLTLTGKASLENPAPSTPRGTAKQREPLADLPTVKADFTWRRDAQGWQWQSGWTGFDKTGAEALHSSVALTMAAAHDGVAPYLEGRGQDLRVQDLAAIALPWLNETQRGLLKDLEPTGKLPELALRITLADNAHPSSGSSPAQTGDEPHAPTSAVTPFVVTARFNGLATRSRGHIPALKNLDGSLSLDQDGGRLELNSRAVKVDAKPLLRAPFALETLAGPLQWQRLNNGLHFTSPGLRLANAALTASLRGSLTVFDDETSPLLDLRMDFRNLDVGQVRHYLPTTIMDPKLTQWLDRALVSGRSPFGEMTLHGCIADLPFDNGQGLFETRLQLQDTILDYSPEWPRIEELDAELTFRNRSLQIEAVAGKILDADLQRVEARIDNLEHSVLVIRGQAQGSIATSLRLLRESPLSQKVGHHLAGMEATGNNALKLELSIPLDHRPTQVKGTLDFAESALNLPAWDIDLKRIQGQLNFTETDLTAKDVRLLFRGEPMRMNIVTRNSQGNRRETQFSLSGQLSPRALTGSLTPGIEAFVTGRGLWDIGMTLRDTPPEAPPEFDLSLTSNLKEVTVKLPPPLGKSAGEVRAFTAHIRSVTANNTAQARLEYGPDTRALLELVGLPNQIRLGRGELRIAAGQANLPTAQGLTVVAHLARLDPFALLGDKNQTMTLPPWLGAVDAQLDELVAGGQSFNNVAVRAQTQKGGFAVQLDGKALTGQLDIPAKPTVKTPLSVDLQRLALQTGDPAQDNPEPGADPRDLPPLRVAVHDLVLDGHSLGRLNLSTTPREDGLRLVELNLQSDFYSIAASGDWLITKQGHFSRLQATLHSKDLGRTLQTFGYTVGLTGGETEAKLTVDWPAPFLRPSPALLTGYLSLHVEKGQLLNVDPGVGRVFGLLNLGSLSRRLMLDFSDFFHQGLGFDRIDGSFNLKGGNAYTDDLTLKAPSAQIHISGRIGLKDKDYNQTMTVTPQVSSSLPLPLAGAIAGGPVVGAVVFIAGRLLKPEIDKVTRYQYSVTGSWDNPVIQPLAAPVEHNKPAIGTGDR